MCIIFNDDMPDINQNIYMGQGHIFLTEVEYKMALEYKFFPSPEQEKYWQ